MGRKTVAGVGGTARPHPAQRVFAYTGLRGSHVPLLARLVGPSGGAVFSLLHEADLPAVAKAHRARPWRIEAVDVPGASDLLLAGRPEFLFPGQELVVVGRVPCGAVPTEIRLALARNGARRTVRGRLSDVVPSELAARTYGQVAVAQLEELEPAAEDAARYARHFHVTGRTCALLMLERDADYEQFHVKPEEDAFVVKHRPASAAVAAALAAQAGAYRHPKARFFARLDRAGRASGDDRDSDGTSALGLSPLTRIAVEAAPPSSFVVEDRRQASREIKLLSENVIDRPDDVGTLGLVAQELMDRRAPEHAYWLLRHAADLEPNESWPYDRLGGSLAAMGRVDLAMAYYELARSGSGSDDFDIEGKAPRKLQTSDLEYLRFLRLAQGGLSPALADLARARRASLADEHQLGTAGLVVQIRWNTDGTDVDLRVTEPSGEECCYDYDCTRLGGCLLEDVRDGFGPETYVLRNAVPGRYTIRACYLASEANKQNMATKVEVAIYENWGTPQEKVTRSVVAVPHAGQTYDLGTVTITPR